ncbi:hypothetical protein EV702DRAFT_1041807 [Suillus placidus]|uniref:Uncharacterized protein n=1 Tax=Suillus placidus TaxID=48579 RepID=A0A9P7A458_9AGAM|nr:hypothetical protein EV702DRAFT_1041807 [Suillus placidus]
MTTPFMFEEVTQAAEKILQQDRFDTDLVYSDTDDSDSEDSDSSADSDSDMDSSSEEEYIKRAKTLKRAKHKNILPSKTTMHKTRFEDSSDEEETPIAKTRKAVHKQRSAKQNPQEEVEDLIQRLGRMRIGDANYSTLYYKAITLDPAVKEIIENGKKKRRIAHPQMKREIYWTIENINEKESEDEKEAYPAYRTEKEGARKRTEIFDGIYPSKGRDTRDETKKGQHQRDELRGDRQYAPGSKQVPIIKPPPPVPSFVLVIEKPIVHPKLPVPEARDFQPVMPKKSSESVKTPQGNPRAEQESIPMKVIGRMEEKGKERKDKPKKIFVQENPPVHVTNEKVQYNAQDNDVVMEDELLERTKVRGKRQQEKGKSKDIPKEGEMAHKATVSYYLRVLYNVVYNDNTIIH